MYIHSSSKSSLTATSSTSSTTSTADTTSSKTYEYTVLEPFNLGNNDNDNNNTTTTDDVNTNVNNDYDYAYAYPYSSRDMQKVIETAEEAAIQAGIIMQQTCGKIAVSSTKMNAADLVTESDVQCQQVIEGVIHEAFPQDAFLGEENVDAGSLASSSALANALLVNPNDNGNDNDNEYEINSTSNSTSNSNSNSNQQQETSKLLWIVDPIDGTTNFQAGLPMFCVSIGIVSLESDAPVVVAGVIYNPVLQEMVTAVRNRGCYLNGHKLHSKSAPPDLKQALVNIGFPISSPATLKASSTAVAAMATKVRGLRMIASASQVMSWVAQGKLTAYVSWDLNAWDVAAGMVIVEEAGGFVANFEGKRAGIQDRDLIVTCKEDEGGPGGGHFVSGQIQRILEENNCCWY
jgi:myo-inositol-1(or 4)-monophosphatase